MDVVVVVVLGVLMLGVAAAAVLVMRSVERGVDARAVRDEEE